jgi:hypothetical protein
MTKQITTTKKKVNMIIKTLFEVKFNLVVAKIRSLIINKKLFFIDII